MSDARQGDQIREVLSPLKALRIEEDVYLKLENVLDATKRILYPEGVETQEQYERLMAISKARCIEIGYSDNEVTLLPPDVDFSERGIYLKKMPELSLKVIERLINSLAVRSYEFISSPYIAITRKKIIHGLANQVYVKAWRSLSPYRKQYLERRCDKVINDIISNSKVINLDDLMRAGLRAAFGMRVDEDPESVIAHQTWKELFDECGYIYDPQEYTLTREHLPHNKLSLVPTPAPTREFRIYYPALMRDIYAAAWAKPNRQSQLGRFTAKQ